MGDKTNIERADATWNPIVGCSLVSPGCTNCYAMKMAARLEAMYVGVHLKGGRGAPFSPSPYAGTTTETKAGAVWSGKLAMVDDHALTKPLRWKRGRRIFVNSMGDLFHESVPDAWIDRVFAVMALAPQHTFPLLTKRSKRMRKYVNDAATPGRIARVCVDLFMAGTVRPDDNWPVKSIGDIDLPDNITMRAWPPLNVWLGVSAEDQTRANERIPDLLSTPAAVRFVSAEPMLSGIDFKRRFDHGPNESEHWDYLRGTYQHFDGDHYRSAKNPGLDWVILGGESGPGARPMHPEWARAIRDQCVAAAVPFFFKQHGEWIGVEDLRNLPGGGGPGFGAYDHCRHDMDAEAVRVGKARAGRLLDGVEHNAFPEPRI